MGKSKKIAILITPTTEYTREIIRGIFKYSGNKSEWETSRIPTYLDRLKMLAEYKLDGIITFSGEKTTLDIIAELQIPIINTSSYSSELVVPRVITDNAEIGRKAAEYFIGLGFRQGAFFGNLWTAFAQTRGEGFCAELARHGISCSVYSESKEEAGIVGLASHKITEEEKTYAWLRDLPKPVGILAWADSGARHLANICLQRHLHIPDEVALLGVDDDIMECTITDPPLSSVTLGGENIGYEAAHMLDLLMSGKELPSREVRLPPMGITVRTSTDTLAVSDPDVASALRYIRAHASEPIGVADVLDAVPLSRRVLEIRFRTRLGSSILEEITRAHVELAKQLLADVEMPNAMVAQRAGFRSINALYVAFRRMVGMSPNAFRNFYHRQ